MRFASFATFAFVPLLVLLVQQVVASPMPGSIEEDESDPFRGTGGGPGGGIAT